MAKNLSGFQIIDTSTTPQDGSIKYLVVMSNKFIDLFFLFKTRLSNAALYGWRFNLHIGDGVKKSVYRSYYSSLSNGNKRISMIIYY